MKNRIIYLEAAEKLTGLMLELPILVDSYAANEAGFVPGYLKWLSVAESCLKDLQKAECSSLAAIRAEVIAIDRGCHEVVEGNGGRKRGDSRKQRRNHAARTIPRANAVLEQVIAPLQDRLDGARELAGQLITLAYQAGMVQKMNGLSGNHSDKLTLLANSLSAYEGTQTGMVQLRMLVSHVDVLVLLDQAIGYANGGQRPAQSTRSAPQ